MPYMGPPIPWDHELIIGDTYQPAVFRLLQSDRVTPYDMTGVTGEAVIRRELGGEVLLTATVVLVDEDDGKFTWTAPYADTDDLQPGTGVFAVRLLWPGGVRRTTVVGKVDLVRRAV